jgi:glycosyltransferase involved in cell wall biosynthesis
MNLIGYAMYINGRFLNQKITGVQRVAHEVSKRIINKYVLQIPKGKSGILYEQFILPFRVSRKKPLISFCNVGPILVRNQYLYIHDVAVFENNNWFSKSFALYYKLIWPILAKRVKKIITVSDFSKAEIIRHLNVSPDKVKVIYNGVSNDFDALINKVASKEKYILTVGSVEPRKNLSTVLSAWNKADLKDNGYKLVVVGGKFSSFNDNGLSQTDKSVVFTGYVSDEELKNYYLKAQGFVYLSLYEGFGLPVLEAMLAKVPVLTSSTTSLKEVSEGYATLVDPLNIDDIANAINKLPSFDENSLEEAYNHAKSFTWERSAEQLINYINECENEDS